MAFVTFVGSVRAKTTSVVGSQKRAYVIGGTGAGVSDGDTGTVDYDGGSGAGICGGSAILRAQGWDFCWRGAGDVSAISGVRGEGYSWSGVRDRSTIVGVRDGGYRQSGVQSRIETLGTGREGWFGMSRKNNDRALNGKRSGS